jgi:hypothetical protein
MKRALILIISCLPLIGLAQQRRGTGVIYGTVVSQNGQVGKHIAIYAEPLGVSRQFPSTISNDHGQYRFENLPWGTYSVYAEDDEAGYLAEDDDVQTQPSVEISRDHPQAEFRVVLPVKAGVVQIQLTNRKTGAVIPWMWVTVATSKDPLHSSNHSCKSSELILVPPDRDLILHIIADGFREWDESAGTGKFIFVPSGTRLTMAVQLDPAR